MTTTPHTQTDSRTDLAARIGAAPTTLAHTQVLPLKCDEASEDSLSDWRPGSSKPTIEGPYLRDFDEGEAISVFRGGEWTRDGFFASDIQDAPWRGLRAQAKEPRP